MLNSIASGADTLCAEVALSLGIDLVCPLLMPASEYRKDFQRPTRDFRYRQAGMCMIIENWSNFK